MIVFSNPFFNKLDLKIVNTNVLYSLKLPKHNMFFLRFFYYSEITQISLKNSSCCYKLESMQ